MQLPEIVYAEDVVPGEVEHTLVVGVPTYPALQVAVTPRSPAAVPDRTVARFMSPDGESTTPGRATNDGSVQIICSQVVAGSPPSSYPAPLQLHVCPEPSEAGTSAQVLEATLVTHEVTPAVVCPLFVHGFGSSQQTSRVHVPLGQWVLLKATF